MREAQTINLDQNDDSSDIKDSFRIAFGSCYGIFDKTSDIFQTIAQDEPDVFVWLGDAAYIDSPQDFSPMPATYIKERFQMTKDVPGYQALLKQSKIIGVWDDHDFGTNDGGKDFEFKDQNRELFLDFIDEPAQSERSL